MTTTNTTQPDPAKQLSTSQTDPAETTETADGKTALTKPADTKAGDAKPAGAPEAYAEFKAPDGYTIDAGTLEAATPIFRELGLSQDQAQRLVDFHSTQMIKAAKGPAEAYETMRTDWQNQVKADPEIGGKLDAVKADIGRALNAIGDAKLASDFKAAMDLTGAGDNPAFIKTFWKLSQFVTEGKHVAGSGPSPAGQQAPGAAKPATGAKAMYPNLS